MSRRRAASLSAALLVVGGLLLGACGDPDQEPPADPGAQRDRAIHAGDRYVALGDSYTAAYKTGKTDKASGPCLRSLANYPRLLADKLDLELTDVSCGGATSDAALSPQRKEGGSVIPAQIEAVTKDTDLVTISMGSNDVDLYGAIIGGCVELAAGDPSGSPCTDLARQNEVKGKRDLRNVENSLTSIIRAVAAKAPQARVVLVGYPQSFPSDKPCANLPIARGDVPFAFQAARDVTDVLASAAKEEGVEYVDVWSATQGHDVCSKDPWIAGAHPRRRDGFAYHPFPEEQRAVADLLVATLS
ncbi:SGNH/GDSL hydrolase family protein [Nocardioides ginsengisoli]|uniref:SGNH/GDSL hydrolase family protein n=1 Tax=Nocardioides ginsengisoli TaxID=363868 RepID=A0ABW3W3E5_9ACTN